jgi:N-acyl-D-amino-acid deacylase
VATYDTVIKGGTIVDGTRLPRYRADIGITDGRIAKIGRIAADEGVKVLDASGHIVAPGFVDVHTHFDGQIFWDPYCTTSGWHGVTSVVVGNCGFGFAPVAPEGRDRAMLMMSRNEQIPFASLKAGMPWDWVTYPEFLDSLDRTPKGVNVLSLLPISPLMVWVMGLDDAKSGRPPTEAETLEMQRLLREGMDAGGCGWSAQRGGEKSLQADYDGTPFPTDVMGDQLCLDLASVLQDYDYGTIQVTPLLNFAEYDGPEAMLEALGEGQGFSERLAEASGKTVIHNVIVPTPFNIDLQRKHMKELADAHARGNRVIAQSGGFAYEIWTEFTLENNNMFDMSDVWRNTLIGSKDDQLARLRDPETRAALVADSEKAALGRGWDTLTISRVDDLPGYEGLVGRSLVDVAAERGVSPVEVAIDLSAETEFGIEFETAHRFTTDDATIDAVAELLHSPHVLPAASDGGAHTKMQVGGKFGTEILIWLVRDTERLSLEEAHWHLSYLSAQSAGFRDRGFLREGAPADILVYDLDNMKIVPEGSFDKVYDVPADEWRRVQKVEGIRYTIVNGEVTFEDGEPTNATPGRLVRFGKG